MQALLETGFDGSHAKEKAEENAVLLSPAGKLVGHLPQHLFRRGTAAAESGTHHGQKAAADAAGRTDSFAGQQIQSAGQGHAAEAETGGHQHDRNFSRSGIYGRLVRYCPKQKNPCSISE